jgi:branched-chain amino acid transport system substrate-binding protein
MQRSVYRLIVIVCLVGALACLLIKVPMAYGQSKEPILIGVMYDQTGPTSVWGVPVAQGARDYTRLINKKGGVQGHPIEWIEHEMGYKVPNAVEGYERFKAAGVVSFWSWGTPIVYALWERATTDKLPTTTPGFGRADATDGERFPYVFPMMATWWSQTGGAVKFVTDQWAKEGKAGKPKIAFLYWDNPAGREPFPILEKLQKQLGFELKSWSVPSPGLEMSAQILDIVRRYRADWVITQMWAKAPAISMKEFKRLGFPLTRVVALSGGAAEHDMIAAGWDVAEGYYGIQIHGVGADYPVHRDIIQMYKDEGKEPPKEMVESSAGYNRGVLWIAVTIEAARLALEKFGWPLTGEKVQKGFELIDGIAGLEGVAPPLKVTAKDHEGGGLVRVFQTRGGKIVPVTDWFHGYREAVLEQVYTAAKEEPPKN